MCLRRKTEEQIGRGARLDTEDGDERVVEGVEVRPGEAAVVRQPVELAAEYLRS